MAQSALTGYRKYRSPDIANINARTPFLSSIYGQKKSDAYADKRYDLDKQGLEQEYKFGEQNLDIAKDAAKQARKRDRVSRNLGYAGLGLQAGFGMLNNADTLAGMFQPEDVVTDLGSEFGSQAVQELGESAVQGSWSTMFGDMFSDSLKSSAGGLLGDSAGGIAGGIAGGLLDSVIDWGGLTFGF